MTAAELAAVKAMLARPAAAAAGAADAAHGGCAARTSRSICARRCARMTGARRRSCRSRGAQRARRTPAAGRAVRYLGLDGSLCAHAAAFPARDHQRPRSRARAAVRHAAHQHHAAPEAPRCRCRARARQRGGGRLGRRHAHRRCLDEFNRRWSRRLLGQNAIVLLISDGLDADVGDGLARRNGAAAQVLPAADLAQSAAALRGLRGAARGHPGDAAARRRFPAGAQSGKPDGARRGARAPAGRPRHARRTLRAA